jgi:hypothetical protein
MRPSAVAGVAILVLGGTVMLVLGQGTPGASPHEGVVKEMLTALDALTDVLGSIKDEPTAKAARADVKKAAGRLEDVKKKAQQLKQPEKAEKDRIAKEYKGKLEGSIKKLLAEVARVKAVPGGDDAVKDIYGGEEKKK